MFEYLQLFGKVVLLPVFGAVFGALIKGHLEDRRLFKPRGERFLEGTWIGFLHTPRISREAITFVFKSDRFFSFRRWFNPKSIFATVTIEDEVIQCRGGFSTEEYLIMDYRSSSKSVLQFGTMQLKLAGSGGELRGTVVGYYDEPFVAKLTLHKDHSRERRPKKHRSKRAPIHE